ITCKGNSDDLGNNPKITSTNDLGNSTETTVPLTVDNTPLAEITVIKTLTGNNALYVTGHFDVTVTCMAAGHAPISQTYQFAPTGTSVPMMAPVGATCTVTEDVSNATLNNGTSRRTIVPSAFKVENTNPLTVSVENELLDGSVSLAALKVTKQVTDAFGGHNPANVFNITVTCPGTGATPTTKTLNLKGGQSGTVDAAAGDVCDVEEADVPANIYPYMYMQTKSQTLSIPVGGREATVTNRVMVEAETADITFIQITVADTPGSGYAPGYLNTRVDCGADGVFDLSLVEGETRTEAVRVGAVCTATRGALPPLNAGFAYEGPTVTGGWPYTVTHGDEITIGYRILPPLPPPANNVPIPTLDPKGLLLLIGLLGGAMFWQRKRLGRQCR
ncbi:MAG: DUF5979 domain-containing protein, partial [Proteobacteria bacterium]|nr:DUF5979 domain-containing protein [Pseudomonadota bacterium]